MKPQLLLLILFFASATIYAQKPAHAPWTAEDSVAINALVMYPDSVRNEIFEACEYPAAIVNIAGLQKKSSEGFSDIIAGYSKEEQENIWNLGRYPDLISRLTEGGKKTKKQIKSILNDYPAEIHDMALKYGREYYEVLNKVNDLNTETNIQFEQLLAFYQDDVRNVFRALIKLPEVLILLNDHLELTVRVGDHYKRDPQWVIHRADSAHFAIARQRAQELEEWKQTMQQDSNARNDFKKAASEYAEDNGYNNEDIINGSSTYINYTEDYIVYPYSFWFGYPVWYPYAYWYPYPYWYDWGFYYGPYGDMIFFGLPSFYFFNWYFYYPYHLYHYPYFGGACIHHYYGPREYINANNQILHRWVQNNRNYLPEDFLNRSPKTVESIRQVGQLRMDVGQRGSAAETANYLQKNSSRYPALNSNPQQARIPEEKLGPEIQRPIKQPAIMPTRRDNIIRTSPNIAPHSIDFKGINNGINFHRSSWGGGSSQPASHGFRR